MDWIRENKLLSTILGVIAAGCLGLGYLLFDSWGGYTTARDEYIVLGTQISQIKSLSLAPTDGNLKTKQALVDEYSSNVAKLSGALFYLQPPVPPIKQSEFQAKLKERVLAVKKLAADAKISLPAEFSFGFSEYLNALPNSDITATELSGYLDGIEAVVKLMLSCRVKSIDLLTRTPLPIEKEAPKATSGIGLGRPSNANRTATKIVATVAEKRQISIVVTLEQSALQQAMSKMANPVDMKVTEAGDQSHFASLRVLRVENQVKEGPIRRKSSVAEPDDTQVIKPIEAPAVKAAGGNTGATEAGPVILIPPSPAAADSVPVIGQELLKAQMEIDLVKFLDASKVTLSQ
jgi:hypothetical protein